MHPAPPGLQLQTASPSGDGEDSGPADPPLPLRSGPEQGAIPRTPRLIIADLIHSRWGTAPLNPGAAHRDIVSAVVQIAMERFDDFRGVLVTAADFPLASSWRPVMTRNQILRHNDLATVSVGGLPLSALLCFEGIYVEATHPWSHLSSQQPPSCYWGLPR